MKSEQVEAIFSRLKLASVPFNRVERKRVEEIVGYAQSKSYKYVIIGSLGDECLVEYMMCDEERRTVEQHLKGKYLEFQIEE